MACILKYTNTIPPIAYWECGGDTPFEQAGQSKVAVSGPNVAAVSAADSSVVTREIVLQNIGTAAIAMKYGTGAASDCSNGEFVLKAGDANNDGKGGSVTIVGWLGQMTAACASSSFLSVSITQ
jgi:hypothetical protein